MMSDFCGTCMTETRFIHIMLVTVRVITINMTFQGLVNLFEIYICSMLLHIGTDNLLSFDEIRSGECKPSMRGF